MTIIVDNDGPVRVITFNHKSTSNPFSREMQLAVTEASRAASIDKSVKSVVFTGGPNRLFSAGGDFNEVKLLASAADVSDWIDTFMDMYLSILHIAKPTLAAIDGYAIGIGFQVALMLDWRIISDSAKLSMPELRHGIGGSVGGAILSALFGAESARQTMLGAREFSAQEALEHRFVHEVVPQDRLMAEVMARAHDRATFPSVAYMNTKAAINQSMDRTLKDSIAISKKVHIAAFEERAMDSHFKNILGRSHRGADSFASGEL